MLKHLWIILRYSNWHYQYNYFTTFKSIIYFFERVAGYAIQYSISNMLKSIKLSCISLFDWLPFDDDCYEFKCSWRFILKTVWYWKNLTTALKPLTDPFFILVFNICITYQVGGHFIELEGFVNIFILNLLRWLLCRILWDERFRFNWMFFHVFVIWSFFLIFFC